MLERVLYMKYYNDIAMLIDGKIVILIEHQSTINKNMPFRFLEYIARIYEKITTKDEKFGRKLVKLPIPEFYVFYNGKDVPQYLINCTLASEDGAGQGPNTTFQMSAEKP